MMLVDQQTTAVKGKRLLSGLVFHLCATLALVAQLWVLLVVLSVAMQTNQAKSQLEDVRLLQL